MDLRPGTQVTPNVRLDRKLATGAMGAVWVADHLTLNTKVAVKFISNRLDPDDPEVLQRFIREASTAAQIKSSHVVQTFDQGVMRNGTPYIVMEFLEGEGLGDRLARSGRLPLDETLKIVGQTAKALASAHKVGVIHRDIKPDNVFLSTRDDELHVKVFDFGIAKRSQHAVNVLDSQGGLTAQPTLGLTNDGVMIGTPEYMSPEQVMSASSVDHHADLWGLAVIAYTCMTGTLPFQGKDVGQLCVRLLEADFPPARHYCPELPPEADAWFKKALARVPEERFQSAREMVMALRAALPMASSPGDSMTSGQFEVMRAPAPSFTDTGEFRGMRAVTLTDLSADNSRSRSWTSSAIGGAVAVAMLTLAVAVFMLVGDAETEQTSETGGDTDGAAAVVVEPPVQARVPAATAEAPAEGSAEPAASASASASASGSASPYFPFPPRRPWRPQRPKDPGF